MFGMKKRVILRISAASYDEIAAILDTADDNGVLDMNGIGLARRDEPEPPKHRPIAKKGSAPGAIS